MERMAPEAHRSTPARLARGAYLVEHVTVCLDCHSQRDWGLYSAPIIAGTEGQGGETFDDRHGVRGVVYGTNITPAGLASWTDDEILRAITAGVNRDGDVLFPVMPYRNYRHLTQGDAAAIITYVRTLPPIEHPVPPRRLSFFVEFLIRSFAIDRVRLAPTLGEGDSRGPPDPIQYGQYLTRLANCGDCHSPRTLAGTRNPIARCPVGSSSPSRKVSCSPPISRPTVTPASGDRPRTDSWRDSSRSLTPSYARAVGPSGMNTTMPWTMMPG